MPTTPDDSIVLIDAQHGRYIPQVFARWHAEGFAYPPEYPESYMVDIAYLTLGPDESAHYWEIWTDVVENAVATSDEYRGWRLAATENGDVLMVAPEEDA